ncbi:SusD/RagB family nutrient-binding outer membrane lipoprotein [uncultured Flavobacterium sp.]|uniref:SusD/RagB family nutrient-binding outer membrane lipoprotein n=1 Tax=uncultured Flavobacterium sp. TaxID=165435 RepID=UPI0030ED0A9B|tara:strand:+ start:17810 stop:19303 length:1494 start_codon:yes stop_codon:yes gene_type:complete
MKKIKILALFAFLSFMSCDNYLDINDSPNNAKDTDVTPDLALAAAQTSSYANVTTSMNFLGNLFMNNWGYDVNSFAVTNPAEFSYSIDNNFYAAIWNTPMRNTANLSNIINTEFPNYENHVAIAKICKAYYFQILVDMYGDVPYTEAHQGVADITPAYDGAKSVYRDLYAQLDQAIALIDNSPSAKAVGAEDAVFGGNMSQWKDFANTMKLRLLMRQVDLAEAGTDSETTTYVADKFALLSGASFLSVNATLNPGYSDTRADTRNPFWNIMYGEDNTTVTAFYRQYKASKRNADNLNSTSDPRRSRLFTLVGGSVVGVLQGDSSVVNGGTAPAVLSSFGLGVLSSASQDAYMFSLAESLLLQAEAVHRGYLTGSAQSLFDAAIDASCIQLGTTAGTYTGSINGTPGKGYGSGTYAQKIEAIMYQKNIALQGTSQSLETFIEYTRTGLIDSVPGSILGATQANRPRRLLYPTSEYTSNSANVPAQGNVFATGSFWYAY